MEHGQERRPQAPGSSLLVRVSIKDSCGGVYEGKVLSVSEEEVGILVASVPGSELLEIQPANSHLRISVKITHRSSASSGYLLGCVFQAAPTLEILRALNIPR
jgi:hypothetical protein